MIFSYTYKFIITSVVKKAVLKLGIYYIGSILLYRDFSKKSEYSKTKSFCDKNS